MSMKVSFVVKGKQAMIMHSDKLADPLNAFAEIQGKLLNKGSKSKADHYALAENQYYGCCYTDQADNDLDNSNNQIVFPARNLAACIGNTSAIYRMGDRGKQSFYIVSKNLDFYYSDTCKGNDIQEPVMHDEVPTTPKGLYKYAKNRFVDRRNVKIAGQRVPTVRPIFPYWKLVVTDLILDEEILSVDTFETILNKAGSFNGLGDYRREFGRFTVENFKAVQI